MGDRIHLSDCRYSITGYAWRWADEVDEDEWLSIVDFGNPRLKPCQACLPDLVRRQRLLLSQKAQDAQ
jgi:hypothetical protein